ncbi:MAG: hypothetical protein WBG86_14895, partial [Polyangiales bacterium]
SRPPPELDDARTIRLPAPAPAGDREPAVQDLRLPPRLRASTGPLRVLVVAMLVVSFFVAFAEHQEARRLRLAMAADLAARDHEGDLWSPAAPIPRGEVEVGDPRIVSIAQVEAEAADLIRTNEFEQALVPLELLRQENPGDQTYADLVVVLRWKLRCQKIATVDGGAC